MQSRNTAEMARVRQAARFFDAGHLRHHCATAPKSAARRTVRAVYALATIVSPLSGVAPGRTGLAGSDNNRVIACSWNAFVRRVGHPRANAQEDLATASVTSQAWRLRPALYLNRAAGFKSIYGEVTVGEYRLSICAVSSLAKFSPSASPSTVGCRCQVAGVLRRALFTLISATSLLPHDERVGS